MGRRVFKREERNGSTTSHLRFLYRDYLQIAAIDLTRPTLNAMWFITWDPPQPIATRPLTIPKDGTWYTYGLDLTKNVCEVFGSAGYIATTYTYPPYGEVTGTGNIQQPIQWSSEFYDSELALVYYNYRHYNPKERKWIGRDKIVLTTQSNSYTLTPNNTVRYWDRLGLYVVLCFSYQEGTITGFRKMEDSSKIENLTPKVKNVFFGNYDKKSQIDHTNNPDSQHVIDRGSIPIGEYWIDFEYTPDEHIQDAIEGGNDKWHKLYGDNGNGGKSYDKVRVLNPETGKYEYRGGFNLHTGCASNGCVTIESEIEDDTDPEYPQSSEYDRLNEFINQAASSPLRNPRNRKQKFLGILLVEKCQKDCEKSLKAYKRKLLSLLMIFFFFMGSMGQADTVVDTNSQAIQTALAIEKIAKSAPSLEFESEYSEKIRKIIDNVQDEQTLFALAILFHEGYPDFLSSPEDRLMFYAQEHTVSQLAKMGTEQAYHYFKTLKTLYGRDGANYSLYRLREYRYLKQYSEDPEIKNAQSDGKWR